MARLLRFKPSKTPSAVNAVLADLVHDAGGNTPYYRGLFSDAGIDVGRFDGVEQLAMIPPSSKQDLRMPPERDHLRGGCDPHRCATTSTSGTTGERLTIYMSKSEHYFRRFSLLLAYRHYVPLRFPLHIADVGPLLTHRGTPIEQRLGLVRVLRIPGDTPLEEQRAALSEYRPTILQGFPTCLERLVESLSAEQTKRLRPVLVASRGETLEQRARDMLERALHARVVDLYNCEEVGNMAWECPDQVGRFHVNTDTCVIEVLDDDGNRVDEQGDIVVTNLYNHTMPFLRYRIEDEATLKHSETPCSCGAQGAWLENFATQQYDAIATPDGQHISPRVVKSTLFHALRSIENRHQLIPQLRRYQLVQREDYSLHVRLDWQGPPAPDVWRRIVSDVERVTLGLPCTVEKSGDLELTPAGKFKVILSRIPREANVTSSA